MSFVKSKSFKYIKNLIIGLGAALVMLGALYKIQSWEMPTFGGIKFDMLSIGLITEAILFTFLGVIGPEPDYYWDKLYPGLDEYNSHIAPLTAGAITVDDTPGLNGEVVEQQLGGMLTELQTMSKSLSSLKALQEVDFSGTSDQISAMSSFYAKLNEAMANLSDSLEDTHQYREQLAALNQNIAQLNTTYDALNGVYGNMISAMANVRGVN